MKRVELFEFEDQPWLPGWMRDSVTGVLAVLNRAYAIPPVVAELAKRALKDQGLAQIVDLGSGSGGVMPDVMEALRQDPETAGVQIVLTDKHPNQAAIARFNRGGPMRYETRSVDATSLAEAPPGLKTMVNCFHHMPPERARAILKSARDSRQPILIYEMGDNALPFAAWAAGTVIGLPLIALMCVALTPWSRPLNARQLVFTYLIPVLPLLFAWDGHASMARIYTSEDLDGLLEGLDGDGYRWEKGPAPNRTGQGNYLLGTPTDAS